MAHEIMENDYMFSVATTPWHGLGIVLDNPPSIYEGLLQAKLDWKVDLLPLYYEVQLEEDNLISSLEEAPAKAVIREDTKEVLGVVGVNYTPLQNIEAFSIFEPLVEAGKITLETAGSLKNGRRVWVLASIPTILDEISHDDIVKPYILLSNSHDGTMAVRFGFTPVRVVCNNTLSMAEISSSSKLIRILHKKNVKDNIAELASMLDVAEAKFTATMEQFKFLSSKDINSEDLIKYINVVMVGTEDAVITPTHEKIISFFEAGRGSHTEKAETYWGAYNSINEWLLYSRGRSVDNRLNNVWFAEGAKVNNKALVTALKMAE